MAIIPITVEGIELTNLDTKTPALGQAVMAISSPVVIASNQSTIPVSIAIAPALVASSAVIGHVIVDTAPSTPITNANLDVALSTRLKPADTLAGVTTVTAVTAITNALPAGTNRIGLVRPVDSADADLTTIKGTQTSRALGVQDLKDSGRNQTNFFTAIQIVTTNTDTLLSLTGYKSGAAVNATTTPAVVTSGKTYRITAIEISYTTIITTPGSTRITLRANTGGTVQITSPVVAIWEVGEPNGIAPVAGKKNTIHLNFPDGIEFSAGTGIGISQLGLNTVGAAAAVGYGQVCIIGFEY